MNSNGSDTGVSCPVAHTPYRLIPDKKTKREDTVIPLMGWYFAFRINPEVTFSTLRTDEIAAFRARGRLYVGYMDQVSHSTSYILVLCAHVCLQMDGLFDHSQSLHLAFVVLLSPERSSNEKRYRTADMTVAVSPNPDVVMDRQPVQTDPPLPWAHAYHNTVDCEIPVVRVQSRRLACPNYYQISVEECSDLEIYASEDREKRSALAPAMFGMFRASCFRLHYLPCPSQIPTRPCRMLRMSKNAVSTRMTLLLMCPQGICWMSMRRKTPRRDCHCTGHLTRTQARTLLACLVAIHSASRT
jgi:hypothetical protein